MRGIRVIERVDHVSQFEQETSDTRFGKSIVKEVYEDQNHLNDSEQQV